MNTNFFVLLFLCSIFGAALAGKILAPAEDTYLLVTVRNDTTFKEFLDLFNFYLKISSSCETCIPPITNCFAYVYFGQVFHVNFNDTSNTTAQIESFMNSTNFEKIYFNTSKTDFSNKTCHSTPKFKCLDIEWMLSFLSVGIKKTFTDPAQKIRKKQIAILTNYYYQNGYDSQLSQTLYQSFNFTVISLIVPSKDFLDLSALRESQIPITVFDMSEKKLDYKKASEAFLNRYIDFDYENAIAPVAGFLEISYPHLSPTLNFFLSVFDKSLCQLSNDSEYYQLSLLITFDSYQYQFDLIIPNLQGFAFTYVENIVYDYLNSPLLQTPKLTNCNETFYQKVAERLAPKKAEQFNFFITDNYPTCMVDALEQNGITANSRTNHLEIFIHSPLFSPTVNEEKVFEEITSKLFPPSSTASKIANHVSVVDLSNLQPTFANIYGICQDSSLYRNLTSALPITSPTASSEAATTPPIGNAKNDDWEIIGGILCGFILLSSIVIWLLAKVHEQVRLKTFIKRTETEKSGGGVITRMRLASTLIAASNFATEVVVEGQGPAQYLSWRINPTLLQMDYTKILGKGSSATIYGAFLNCRSPLSKLYPSLNTQHFRKCFVAVKVSLVYGSNDSEQFNNEVKSMTMLEWHPNICSFLGWSMSRERPCLIFEYIPNDLLRYVKGFRNTGGMVPPKDILLISWQIANGMAYIAQHKLVHRDLACRNVLLTEDLRVKITDFGLCCDCDHSYTYTGSISKRLPIKWLAPEALLDRLFSEKSDVWSFGVLLYEILTCGIVPYATMSNEEMLEFLRDGKRLAAPEGSPQNVADLMKECWHAVPDSRPSFFQIREKISGFVDEDSESYGYLAPSDILYRHQTSINMEEEEQKRHSIISYPTIIITSTSDEDDDEVNVDVEHPKII